MQGIVAVTARKRVLFLINSLTGGGAERVMCTLLRHSEAERQEFDMTLALLDDEPRANEPPAWLETRQLDCGQSLLRSMRETRELFAELKPDVAVSFLTRSNFANVVNANCPSIISERAHTSAHLSRGARDLVSRATVRLLYPRATRVIAVSEGVAQNLRDNFGVRPERLVSIANPVDIEALAAKSAESNPVSVEGPYILGVGRFVGQKNFELLIRAYAASGDARRLVIAGDGAERDALRAVAAECGVGDKVLFPGFVVNPYPLMRGASLFVLPSNSEGFPNAMVESMAMGVPVIATNCNSGPSEILADAPRESITSLTFAPHGVLTPPNEVAPMAEAIRALQDPARSAAYAAAGAERAKHFGAVASKDRYWAVIRDVLRERGRASDRGPHA
jgi:N-acetylgalactosamine-N,N'-diacetylbacillosaminyl-diphospho-undecaprenol 4-alpha-N-acetylgalactosaminyltransferase